MASFNSFQGYSKTTCPKCSLTYVREHTCHGPRIGHLTIDKELLTLAVFLGGEVEQKFIERLFQETLTWGIDGEAAQKPPPEIIRVSRDASRWQQARLALINSCCLHPTEDGLSVPFSTQKEIQSNTKNPLAWQLRAIKAVLHVFPEHLHLELAQYGVIARACLPQLQHVLEYLRQRPVRNKLGEIDVHQLVNVCLSASNFLEIGWKLSILDVAELFCINQDDRLRLTLRKITLARLSRNPGASLEKQLCQVRKLSQNFSIQGKRSNALFGELAAFEARVLIDFEQLPTASQVLREFQPLEPHNVSLLERTQLNQILYLQGELARYQGRFEDAEGHFLKLVECTPTPPKVWTQLSAVSCELRRFTFAASAVQEELDALQKKDQPKDTRHAIRLQLALADAWLMNVVYNETLHGNTRGVFALNRGTSVSMVGEAKKLLTPLWQRFADPSHLRKVGMINRFRVSFTLAVAEHVVGDPEIAIGLWDQAQSASRDMWPKGFTDSIIMLSKADLKHKLGDFREAFVLHKDALDLRKRTGDSFRITGLGTTWPCYVTNRLKQRGLT